MSAINVEISPHKLRRARGKRTQTEAARLAGISRQALWLIETGRTKPTGDVLVRLCLLYGVQLHDLIRQT